MKYKPVFKNKQLLVKLLNPLVRLNEESLKKDLEAEVVSVGEKVENYSVGDIVMFDENKATPWTYFKDKDHYRINDEMFVNCLLVEE